MCRQSLFYHRQRKHLFDILGRVCAWCGRKRELEFDVIVPQGDPKGHHGRMSSNQRVVFYRRQHEAGNLQVLCTCCNSRKGRTATQNPF